MLAYSTYHSPLGKYIVCVNEHTVCGIWRDKQAPKNSLKQARYDPTQPRIEHLSMWLDRYFAGDNPNPRSLQLHVEGTDFQRLVWEELLTIPFGETESYGELARRVAKRVGKPRMSAQAIGGAVGKNPISLVIPCHRVVGAQGQLTGYAGGLEAKRWLLDHEQKYSLNTVKDS